MELKEFKFCPQCGAKQLLKQASRFSCKECDYVFYQNTAAATAIILKFQDAILMTRREKNPAQGKLDLPGGFVDSGENAELGILRELKEELNLELSQDALSYWRSFSNVYVYKGVSYDTCDLIFEAQLETWPTSWQTSEISCLEKVKLADLDLDQVGFTSIKRALYEYKNR